MAREDDDRLDRLNELQERNRRIPSAIGKGLLRVQRGLAFSEKQGRAEAVFGIKPDMLRLFRLMDWVVGGLESEYSQMKHYRTGYFLRKKRIGCFISGEIGPEGKTEMPGKSLLKLMADGMRVLR